MTPVQIEGSKTDKNRKTFTFGDMHDLRLLTAAFVCSARSLAFLTDAEIDSVRFRFFSR